MMLPKSIKYLMFLAFIIISLAIVPLIFHMMGIHCNSDRQVMKTSLFNIGDNYEVSTLTESDVYNSSNYNPTVSFGAGSLVGTLNTESCSKLIKFDHTSIFGNWYDYCDNNDTASNNSACVYALRISHLTGLFSKSPACIVCEDIRDVQFFATNTLNNGKYCFSDAYPNNESSCPNLDLCDIPYGYKFSNDTGRFVCDDISICGANATEVIYDIDIKLQSMGAVRYYAQTTEDKSYNSAVKFKCDSSLNPQLTFFGVPFFDYKLWLMLMLLGAMFFFYMNYIRR